MGDFAEAIAIRAFDPNQITTGVTFCLVEQGVDEATFEAGLTEWRKRHAHKEAEDDSLDDTKSSEQDDEEQMHT